MTPHCWSPIVLIYWSFIVSHQLWSSNQITCTRKDLAGKWENGVQGRVQEESGPHTYMAVRSLRYFHTYFSSRRSLPQLRGENTVSSALQRRNQSFPAAEWCYKDVHGFALRCGSSLHGFFCLQQDVSGDSKMQQTFLLSHNSENCGLAVILGKRHKNVKEEQWHLFGQR